MPFRHRAIDGTKITANASMDANGGRQWLDEQVAGMAAESESVGSDCAAVGAGIAGRRAASYRPASAAAQAHLAVRSPRISASAKLDRYSDAGQNSQAHLTGPGPIGSSPLKESRSISRRGQGTRSEPARERDATTSQPAPPADV